MARIVDLPLFTVRRVVMIGDPHHVLVLGGSGFVGRAILRDALRRGWKVSSLSRRGCPPTAIASDPALRHVHWIKGNALDRSVYPSALSSVSAIVHCIGTLFESNHLYDRYKDDRPHSPPSSTLSSTSNDDPLSWRTFDVVNKQTALIAAEEAARLGTVKAFGFVSAASFGILTDAFLSGYMRAKREAEVVLLDKYQNSFKTIIVRPGFMYGTDRLITKPIGHLYNLATFFAANLFPRALPVDAVARTLLEHIQAVLDHSTDHNYDSHHSQDAAATRSPGEIIEVSDIILAKRH